MVIVLCLTFILSILFPGVTVSASGEDIKIYYKHSKKSKQQAPWYKGKELNNRYKVNVLVIDVYIYKDFLITIYGRIVIYLYIL